MVISYSPKPWEARIPKTPNPKDRKRSYDVFKLEKIPYSTLTFYEYHGVKWLTSAEVTMMLIQNYHLTEVVVDVKPTDQYS